MNVLWIAKKARKYDRLGGLVPLRENHVHVSFLDPNKYNNMEIAGEVYKEWLGK